MTKYSAEMIEINFIIFDVMREFFDDLKDHKFVYFNTMNEYNVFNERLTDKEEEKISYSLNLLAYVDMRNDEETIIVESL